MLDDRKSIIFFGLLALFGVIIFLFFVWGESEPKKETNLFFPESKTAPNYIASNPKSGQIYMEFTENNPFSPAIEAFDESISSVGNEGGQNNLKSIKDLTNSLPRPLGNEFLGPTPPPQTKKPEEKAVTVTEEEVFAFAYSPTYVATLKSFTPDMIDLGFLPAGSDFPISNMTEAIKYQDIFADFVEKYSDLPKSQVDIYRVAYRELLPRLWKEELILRKKSEVSFLPMKFFNLLEANLVKRKINNLLASIKNQIIPSASAFVLSPECAQEGATLPGIPVPQRSAPCCNCRAGPKPIGCLNKVCVGRAAIFDQLTGICACGI